MSSIQGMKMKHWCPICKEYTDHNTIAFGDNGYRDIVSGAGTDYRTIECVVCKHTATYDFEPDRR